MKIQCPACFTELNPQATQCPICLRPRTRHEMMKDLSKQRHEDQSRRRKPYYIAGAVLAAVAVVYIGSAARKMIASRPPAPKPAPVAPAPAPAPPPVQKEWERPNPPPQAIAPMPVVAPSSPTASMEPVAQEPEEPEGWRVRGRAYDLISLKPAAGAKLIFENRATGDVYTAKADARGKYKIDLPPLTDGGYWVTVKAKGYRGDYLEEGSPPFASRTQAGREEAAADAAQSKVLHVPVFLDKQDELEYNAALLPTE